MSLNCLRCQKLGSAGSEKEHAEGCVDEKPHFKLHWSKFGKADRSWSGNLAPRPYKKIVHETTTSMVAAQRDSGIKRGGGGHRSTIHRSGPIRVENGPKLARSCGMRREWSFEDLRQRVDDNIRGH